MIRIGTLETKARWALVLALAALARLPALLERRCPTLFFDEAIYAFKARNWATFGSHFAPDSIEDLPAIYPPLYSLVLAPAYRLSVDPVVSYRLMLGINALLGLVAVAAIFRLAAADFPSRRWTIAGLVAVWSVPAGYSYSLMSEALFIPLFLWSGVLYRGYAERPSWWRSLGFTLAVSALVMTRHVGSALLLPLAVLASLPPRGSGWKLAGTREALRRLPWVLLPALAVAGWERWTGGAGTDGRALSLLGLEPGGLVDALVGQAAYLNFATFGLLAVACFSWLALRGGIRPEPAGPAPLGAYWLLMGGALFVASVVFMAASAATSPLTRYQMYGRYVDVLVPLVVLYAVGGATARFDGLASRRAVGLAAAAAGLFLLGSFHLTGYRLEGLRILNMGAAWREALVPTFARIAPGEAHLLFGLAMVVIVSLGVAATRWRAGGAVVAGLLVIANLANVDLVRRHQAAEERMFIPYFEALDRLRREGGSLVHSEATAPMFFYLGRYVLYERSIALGSYPRASAGDLLAVGRDLVPATAAEARVIP